VIWEVHRPLLRGWTVGVSGNEVQHVIESAEAPTGGPFAVGDLVEDDPNNALYLEELIKSYFTKVYVVGTGLDAIKLVNKQSVDLVLMDVRLPDISGYEATKAILQNFPGMKIIAQTAYAAYDERQRALDTGCVDYISKPANREQLLLIISKHLKM
jgi:CheY-like chemotaxis protein